MNSDVISQNEIYTVTADSVIQGDFIANAVSPTEIQSNYKSPSDSAFSPIIEFRLSFNSRDNELIPGNSHYAVIGIDSLIQVGIPQSRPVIDAKPLAYDTQWTIRVNMRPVFDSFKEKGYFVTATGDSIHKEDFKGVWIAGNASPLDWDFDNLYGKDYLKLHATNVEGIYAVTIPFNPKPKKDKDNLSWKIDKPNEDYPQYNSKETLVDALYNMAIDDISKDIRHDNTFRAGDEWDGVWTRDVSYSTYLALAYLDPTRAMNSLRSKVKGNRIIQDTGTGGSWPVSSDRIVWTIAAWEVYKVTGDKNWLKYAYSISKNTIDDDREVIWDRYWGLMHGEQSYLDWREQSYPKWMQPKDIYESMCLSTNVLYANAYSILSEMGEELGIHNGYDDMAKHLKDAINQNLWQENHGYYSEYLYGGIYPIKSPGIDNLGQALSIILNIADDDRAETLIQKTPFSPFGIPSIYPAIKDIKPYHNDAVWPFVQAFWNMASARTGNENALRRGLGAMYRAAALFGTHKELFIASSGDYKGTAINSDRQLWSASGNIAMIYRVFAGMEFKTNGIEFNPFVPICIKGEKSISGFHYRKSILDITIDGTGNEIKSITIDGKNYDDNFFPATMTGKHSIHIVMKDGRRFSQKVHLQNMAEMPATPHVIWGNDKDSIINYSKELRYSLWLNGELSSSFKSSSFTTPHYSNYTKAYIIPSTNQYNGFMSQPYEFIPEDAINVYQCEDFAIAGTNLIKGSEANRFVEISTTLNTDIAIPVITQNAGTYLIDFRYANGNGPINTDNKCAIRSVIVNTHHQGALIFPQRGMNEWMNTGYTNMLQVELLKGKNIIQLKYVTPYNINMNGTTNSALIDYMRVIKK